MPGKQRRWDFAFLTHKLIKEKRWPPLESGKTMAKRYWPNWRDKAVTEGGTAAAQRNVGVTTGLQKDQAIVKTRCLWKPLRTGWLGRASYRCPHVSCSSPTRKAEPWQRYRIGQQIQGEAEAEGELGKRLMPHGYYPSTLEAEARGLLWAWSKPVLQSKTFISTSPITMH